MESKKLKYGLRIGIAIAVFLCLASVYVHSDALPANILTTEWCWMYSCGAICLMGLAFCAWVCPGELSVCLPSVVSWSLIFWGVIETLLGLSQLGGWIPSKHWQFILTGSFYNPGPYGGYLAMVFPLALHECLKRRDKRRDLLCYVACVVMFLMVCVLPATRSRSAWLACGVSSAMVLGFHYRSEWKYGWMFFRKHIMLGCGIVILLFGGVMAGMYEMKKDSADGRLFMWKVASQAVMEHPLSGCGWNRVAGAYGRAQESYFAKGDYTEREERIAASPRCVFNEYLQIALAWGIPVLVGLIVIWVWCGYHGYRKGEYGLCGALASLAVFALASYPFRFPGFVSAFVLLLLTCTVSDRLGRCRPMRWGIGCLLVVGGLACLYWGWKEKEKCVACKKWNIHRIYYRFGAYEQVVKCYEPLYNNLQDDVDFLYEYGHALHKLKKSHASNDILMRADSMSSDPMILNVMGQNFQMQRRYAEAEHCFKRAASRLPNRIYPYYLLACLYADSGYWHPEKLQKTVEIVRLKEPKVNSTAVRQMKEEASKLLVKTKRSK